MRIYHNLPALNSYNFLNRSSEQAAKSLERLSSGLRINRAADDAAGLAISEKMRGQIRGLSQAVRNAQDGISMIQTAEGALTESHSILQRMRELSVQAANDTLTMNDRTEVQKEIDQLKDEIDRVANTTEFNTKKLLDGTASALSSSDKLQTRVIVRDGLRVTDSFGQKQAGGGNYKIEITANPGEAQVQKSDIFKMKQGTEGSITIDPASGITALSQSGLKTGSYTLNVSQVDGKSRFNDSNRDKAWLAGAYQQNTANGSGLLEIAESLLDELSLGGPNASLAFEVTGVSTATNEITVNITSDEYQTNGTYQRVSKEGVVLKTDGSVQVADLSIGNLTLSREAFRLSDRDHFSAGDKFVLNMTPRTFINDDALQLRGGNYNMEWTFDDGVMDNQTDRDLNFFQLDSSTGELREAKITFSSTTLSESVTTQNFVAGPNLSGVSGDGWIESMNYTLTAKHPAGAVSASAGVQFTYNQKGETGWVSAAISEVNQDENASALFEIVGIDGNQVKLAVSQWYGAVGGTQCWHDGIQTVTLNAGATTATGAIGATYGYDITLGSVDQLTVGDKFIVDSNRASAFPGEIQVTLSSRFRDPETGVEAASDYMNFTWLVSDATSFNWHMYYFTMDESSGQVYEHRIGFFGLAGAVDQTVTWQTGDKAGVAIQTPDPTIRLAGLSTRLSDIDKFWDSSGNYLLEDPKDITLIQGDGKRTSITLFSTDTIEDVRDKLNAAIADGLGQGNYVTGTEKDRFVSFVTEGDDSGPEAVAGTFVIRSLIAGDNGRINFIGDEALINALSLTTIQSATENRFQVDVQNAHTGDYVARDVNIAGNLLVGTVHKNVDVMFDPNAGIRTSYNAATKNWDLRAEAYAYTTYVHLSDNTQVFQIGANEKQDLSAAIGRMDTLALGISNIIVTDRESAGRAITKLDAAIGRVSSQRSSLGAVQNRIEHTINNLSVANENLTAAESRIRDADIAQETITYTRWNILSQAGTAMLAQANQQAQLVLQLMGT